MLSLFVLILLFTPSLSATSPVALPTDLVTPVADVGGVMRAATVADGYAYLGEGHQVTILDLATPQQPVPVAQIPLTAPITAITMHESIAYIIAWGHLVTVDVRTPTQPRILSNQPMVVRTPVNANPEEAHEQLVNRGVLRDFEQAKGDGSQPRPRQGEVGPAPFPMRQLATIDEEDHCP